MQLEATRMALLLESLERIPGFVSGKHIVQAKVDAWHVSVSHKMAAEVEKLDALTFDELHAAPMILDALGIHGRTHSDERAVRVSRVDLQNKIFRSEGAPQRCGIVALLASPIIVGEDWDWLGAAKVGMSFLLQGPPGCGKTWRARQIVEAVAPKKWCM